MMLSVRLPDEEGTPLVHDLQVKQHKTCMFHIRAASALKGYKIEDLYEQSCW